MRVDLVVPKRLKNHLEKSPYEIARKQYIDWRNRTLESKIYICTLFALARGKCPFCGVDMILTFKSYDEDDAATLDHIVPLSVTMEHSKAGLQIMCKKCNSSKENKKTGTASSGFSFLDVARAK